MTNITTEQAQLHAKGITTMPAAPGFGQALRTLRERERLTQAGLAGCTGINHSTLSLLESGKRQPSHGMVLRIAAALTLSQHDEAWLECSAGFAPTCVSVEDVMALVDSDRTRTCPQDASDATVSGERAIP